MPLNMEKKFPALDLDLPAQTTASAPRKGPFCNSILARKCPAWLRQLADGSKALTGEGPDCNLGSGRMSETLHLLFSNKNWVGGKTGLWF